MCKKKHHYKKLIKQPKCLLLWFVHQPIVRGSEDDEDSARRSAKLSALLVSFEAYVNEVVMSNHGTKNEDMVKIVRDNFRRSVQANVDFHGEMSRIDEGDVANSNYHKVMSDVYKSLLT